MTKSGHSRRHLSRGNVKTPHDELPISRSRAEHHEPTFDGDNSRRSVAFELHRQVTFGTSNSLQRCSIAHGVIQVDSASACSVKATSGPSRKVHLPIGIAVVLNITWSLATEQSGSRPGRCGHLHPYRLWQSHAPEYPEDAKQR